MPYFITVKMNTSDAATKIQIWYKRLPGCRHCGCKRLQWNYVCDECYHDKHRPGLFQSW